MCVLLCKFVSLFCVILCIFVFLCAILMPSGVIYCKGPGSSVWDQCKLLWSCQGSDPGSNLGKLLESGGNQGEVPVSGLSGESGSTCVVDGPNT